MPKGDDYETIKVFSKIKDLMKENEKLKKEIEDYKLREIGYNKKIEELTFALNNINQENILLKLDLENQKKELEKSKKELEKRKKEINILLSRRNLNLNLNNQTTYNINTSDERSNNYKELNNKNNNKKKNNNTIIRTFISKTPEGLQRKGRRIIIINNSFMKPYLKKNAVLNKSNNKSINKDEEINNSNSNHNSNKMNKNNSGTIDIIKMNKNVSCNDIGKKKVKKHKINNEFKDLKEKEKDKEDYKNLLINLQRENEALKAENQRIKKNYFKSLSKESSPIKEHKK